MTLPQTFKAWLYKLIFDRDIEYLRINQSEEILHHLRNDWWRLNGMEPRTRYTPTYNSWIHAIADVERLHCELAQELDELVYGPDNRPPAKQQPATARTPIRFFNPDIRNRVAANRAAGRPDLHGLPAATRTPPGNSSDHLRYRP